MKHENHEQVFSTGARRYAYSSELSLLKDEDGEWVIGYGRDGIFWLEFEIDRDTRVDNPLSKADLLELARHEIEKWNAFEKWIQGQPTSRSKTEILEDARQEIRFATQNCEEIGIGEEPLSEESLVELETEARRLLDAIAAYRSANQPTATQENNNGS